MSQRTKRTHDRDVYLSEDRYERPKEIFKLLADRVAELGEPGPDQLVCDMGCASGEFIYYLQRRFPRGRFLGVELVPELAAKAAEKVPGAEFRVGSVLERDLLPPDGLDLVFLQGVLSIFDEFQPTLENLIHWTRPGGRIFIFGAFNPHPIDVWVYYRPVDHPDPQHRESGWNIFSKESISRFLDQRLGTGHHAYTPFEMPFDLPPHPGDPVRAWTMRDAQGNRLNVNGLSLLLNLEVLEIQV